jgi:hypothetical protein
MCSSLSKIGWQMGPPIHYQTQAGGWVFEKVRAERQEEEPRSCALYGHESCLFENQFPNLLAAYS